MAEGNRYRKRQLIIRLFDEEMEILEAKAKGFGVSKSDYIRDIIFYGEVRRNRQPILNDEKFRDLLYEINRIGNNLNQIAYISNLKKSTGKEEIAELRKQYDDLLSLYEDTFLYPEEDANGNDE